LAPGFFAILVGFFFIVLILRSVRYAYESLGVSSNTAIFLLLATLIGSFFNIPITELSPERAMSHHHVDFFGMRYAVPAVSHWKGTLVAVNVGGAVIPTLMSIYLLFKRDLWVKGLLATAIVALVIHWMADPVPGLGIAVPVFMPVVVTAIVAMLLSREDSAPLAYIAGSLGTLIGADLTNLHKVRGLGAPVASIAVPGLLTAYSSPAFLPCCWRAFTRGRAQRRPVISEKTGSGGPLHPHDAKSGIKVYMDV
jgi:uncharacterized membrane protein